MEGKIVTVIDMSNYQESYGEPTPFKAEVEDKYGINTVVVSQKTGKRYELYDHQIVANIDSSRGESYIFEDIYVYVDGTLIPPEVYSPQKIIKLADLKEVINDIDKGEITVAKGAEILNDIVLETESKQVKELYKKLFDLHDYTHEILQELIELKRDIHKK